jgi:hypothetical protein
MPKANLDDAVWKQVAGIDITEIGIFVPAGHFEFLHMMAPYLDQQTIRKVIESKTPQSRERLIEDAQVPSFRELKKSLS